MSVNRRISIRYWAPVIVWMGVVFLMSTEIFSMRNTSLIVGPLILFFVPNISARDLDMVHRLIRKSGHFTEYFILGLLLFRAFRAGSPRMRAKQWAFSSIAVVLLYAAGDELHQALVSARTASVVDVGIDTAAGIIAQGAALLKIRCILK